MNQDTYVFHAGTIVANSKILTSSGRVLGITAKAKTLKQATNKAYKLIDNINFEGAQYRNDIGKKAFR